MGMDSSMLMEMAHSKHVSEQQKTAAVSQQFESVLVKQFLKEALKPMFKGVFNEDGNAHRLYRHFFTDAISESIASGGGFGVSTLLQQQLAQPNTQPSGGESAPVDDQPNTQASGGEAVPVDDKNTGK